MISSRHIAKAVVALIDDGASDQVVAEGLLRFFKEYHLEAQLPEVLRVIEQMESERQQHRTLMVEAVAPISSEVLALIKERFGITEPVTVERLPGKQLKGGVRARYKDQLLDASVLSTLARLQEALMIAK